LSVADPCFIGSLQVAQLREGFRRVTLYTVDGRKDADYEFMSLFIHFRFTHPIKNGITVDMPRFEDIQPSDSAVSKGAPIPKHLERESSFRVTSSPSLKKGKSQIDMTGQLSKGVFRLQKEGEEGSLKRPGKGGRPAMSRQMSVVSRMNRYIDADAEHFQKRKESDEHEGLIGGLLGIKDKIAHTLEKVTDLDAIADEMKSFAVHVSETIHSAAERVEDAIYDEVFPEKRVGEEKRANTAPGPLSTRHIQELAGGVQDEKEQAKADQMFDQLLEKETAEQVGEEDVQGAGSGGGSAGTEDGPSGGTGAATLARDDPALSQMASPFDDQTASPFDDLGAVSCYTIFDPTGAFPVEVAMLLGEGGVQVRDEHVCMCTRVCGMCARLGMICCFVLLADPSYMHTT
jgi:hypothetical protein